MNMFIDVEQAKLQIFVGQNKKGGGFTISVNGKSYKSNDGIFSIPVSDVLVDDRGFSEYDRLAGSVLSIDQRKLLYNNLVTAKTVGPSNISNILNCDRGVAKAAIKLLEKHGIVSKYFTSYIVLVDVKPAMKAWINNVNSMKEKEGSMNIKPDIKSDMKEGGMDMKEVVGEGSMGHEKKSIVKQISLHDDLYDDFDNVKKNKSRNKSKKKNDEKLCNDISNH